MGDLRKTIPADEKFTAGVFLIDKPAGVTSFSVVRDVRRLLDVRKVGHAGTLDPFATGLLIVCAGRPATRLIERFMAGRKRYRAEIRLGVETDTLDPEGKVVRTLPVPELGRESIITCLEGFVGRQEQVPPIYSAVKHKGKPLYHYARKGVEIRKEPREIEIFSIDFLGYDPGSHRLGIEVVCSRGTYVRVLAVDIGRKLGSCAFLCGLRRLASGRFQVENSLAGEVLRKQNGAERLLAGMMPLEEAAALMEEKTPAGTHPVDGRKNSRKP
ncbi:MAG: tRNA pseudouridine(55) synthase TruB [Desulfobulbaceae bacterium]